MEKSPFFFKSTYFWSSCSQMFFKGGVLNSYAIFTGKHLRWSPFLIKFQSFRPATLKVTPMKVFYGDYWKNFKKTFFIEHLCWLLLLLVKEDLYFKIWHAYFYLKMLACKVRLTDSFRALKITREGIFLISTRAVFLAGTLLIKKKNWNLQLFLCGQKVYYPHS